MKFTAQQARDNRDLEDTLKTVYQRITDASRSGDRVVVFLKLSRGGLDRIQAILRNDGYAVDWKYGSDNMAAMSIVWG